MHMAFFFIIILSYYFLIFYHDIFNLNSISLDFFNTRSLIQEKKRREAKIKAHKKQKIKTQICITLSNPDLSSYPLIFI